MLNSCVRLGKDQRASQLPCGSCCQLMKWFAGVDLERIAGDVRCGNAAPAAGGSTAAPAPPAGRSGSG